jgi:serine phosphatase RsbU (regulator of sigma subunit)
MQKKLRLYLYTFVGVGLSVFILGYFGINLSLKYIQRKYIQLQIDVNKRQAERMAFFIKTEIKMGVPLDKIRNTFQLSIEGTEYDKGFLCMYDTKLKQLVCHPDSKVVGMSFNSEFVFQYPNSAAKVLMNDIYSKEKAVGGIFSQGKMRTDIIYTIPIEGTDWFVNAHENIDVISKEIKQLRYNYIFGSLLLGFIIALASSITARSISIKYEKNIEKKNRELLVLNEKINQQNEEITTQLDVIAKKNKEITDSINYAEKIQLALLPSLSLLNLNIPENFVLYKPKAIISGDFYWFTEVEQHFVIVAADCTGHGVPGAFMSILGITLLNEIVNLRGVMKVDAILNELRDKIISSLSQSGASTQQKDGMDIALCIIEKSTKILHYAGAHNPLYIIQKNQSTSIYELSEIKADRMPIGAYPKDNQSFKSNSIQLKANDSIYLFSDGYTSQFGGEKNDTFKLKRLRSLLLSIQNESMAKQKEIIESTLTNWQGKNEQIDDILILGIKIST